MFNLTFYAMPLFFRHQKDSSSWSIYKGENFFNENCILVIKHRAEIRISQVCLRTLLPKAPILTYVIKVVAAKAYVA
jgi:hypothetical protein